MEKQRKRSRKREAIYNAIASSKEHPSAEWIYTKLKGEISDLSLGTVYRNISMFRDEGAIVSVGVVNGQERFDADSSQHGHFVCSVCGGVFDIDTPELDEQYGAYIKEATGATVSSIRLVCTGICSVCGDTAE